MSFSTGTATDINDLSDKWRAFLLAAGWTINRFDTQGTGKRLEVSKGSQFVSMRWYNNESGTFMVSGSNLYGCVAVAATGYSGAVDWGNQAGIPLANDASTKLGVCLPLNAGAIGGYWFFGDAAGDNVVAVIQRASGIYNYLGFGNGFNKLGSWTGGTYLYGCRAASDWTNGSGFSQGITTETMPPCYGIPGSAFGGPVMLRVDVDTVTGKFLSNYIGTTTSRRTDRRLQGLAFPSDFGTQMDNGFDTAVLHSRAYSGLTGGLILFPCELAAERTTGLYSPIGSLPMVFVTYNQLGGFPFGTEFTLGSDTYLAFNLFAVRKTP